MHNRRYFLVGGLIFLSAYTTVFLLLLLLIVLCGGSGNIMCVAATRMLLLPLALLQPFSTLFVREGNNISPLPIFLLNAVLDFVMGGLVFMGFKKWRRRKNLAT